MQISDARQAFPYFSATDAVYLDSAATTQKPSCVIERMSSFYETECYNIHRSGYRGAENTTILYEQARRIVASFLNADEHNIVFTHNATDSLNQAICMLSHRCFKPGKNVITTSLEHNSSLVPLMRACQENDTQLRFIPLEGENPDLECLATLVDSNTVAAVLTMGSNVTGWKLPEKVVDEFSRLGIPTILDASQVVSHCRIDLERLDCDFLCFSAHKMYGPMGVGVLYISDRWKDGYRQRLGGGTVSSVRAEGFVLGASVSSFEAGTPDVAGVLGLGSAVSFISGLGMDSIHEHESCLVTRLEEGLRNMRGVRIIGEGPVEKVPVVSFTSDRLHTVDICKLLGMKGICIRDGKHCAHAFFDAVSLEASARVSFGVYNTAQEVDAFLEALSAILDRYGRVL